MKEPENSCDYAINVDTEEINDSFTINNNEDGEMRSATAKDLLEGIVGCNVQSGAADEVARNSYVM